MKRKGVYWIGLILLAALVVSCAKKEMKMEKKEITDKPEGVVEVGAMAPDFEAQATDGKTIKLSDYRGKWIVLFFYPKAFTGG